MLVNILLFFNIREVYMENDYTDMLQIYIVQPDVVHASLIINNPNNESISDASSEAIFDMFRHLAQTYDVVISYSEANHGRSEYVYYVITNTPIDERFNLLADVSLNFINHVDYFYTNQRNIENGITFFLLNDRIDVRFYPITAMDTIMGGAYFIIARSQAELDEIIGIFMAEFDSYVDEIINFGADPFDIEEAISSFLSPIIVVTMALIALVIIMYFHTNSKKIAILKTMGMSLFQVANKLFLPLLLSIALAIIVLNILLFMFFVGAINVRTVPIIWTLAHSVGLQLLGVTITLILSSLLLLCIPTYSLLKNSNINRFLMGANYILKIIVLIVMLPFLSGRIDLLQDDFNMIGHVRYYERNASITDYQFSPMLMSRYHRDGHTSLMMHIFVEVGIGNVEPNIVYEHQVLYEYHRAFRILNEAGAILCQYLPGFNEIPSGLLVNENYLAKHPVRDLHGNLVNLSQIDSDVVHLVPEIHFSYAESLLTQGYEVVIIDNEQDLFDYSLSWSFLGVSSQPYYIMVYKDSAFRLDASPFRDVFIDDDINELLRETSFYNRILVSTVGDELNSIREWRLQEIVNHMLVMIPTFALILVIIIQYSYLYSKVYRKRIYARKIMGHSQLRIFSQLLIESSLAVFVVASIAWYLELDIRLLAVVMLLDILVYLTVVAISQWKHSLVYDYYE